MFSCMRMTSAISLRLSKPWILVQYFKLLPLSVVTWCKGRLWEGVLQSLKRQQKVPCLNVPSFANLKMSRLCVWAELAQIVVSMKCAFLQPSLIWVQGLLSAYCVALLFVHIPYTEGGSVVRGNTWPASYFLGVLTNCLLLYQEVLFDMSSNNKGLVQPPLAMSCPVGLTYLHLFVPMLFILVFLPSPFCVLFFERGTCIFELAAWLRLSASIPSMNRAPLPLWSCLWLMRGKADCQNLWLTQQLLGTLCRLQKLA